MSAFDLAGDHESATLMDQARANPLDLSQPAGFFSGMGRGAVTGVGRLLADTQRTTGLALGAMAGSFDMLTGDAIKAQEKVFEHIVAPADKLSRHLAPKPEEIGMAGQLLHGLIKIGGEAVAFGAPGVLVNETVGGTLDALDKGVDLQTAGKVGGVQGAAMTAGVIAPMTLGATGLGVNVLYGAGINLAQGVFQRGATSEIYAKAGRHDLAMQFKALDGEAMAVDAILGAAFAGGGRYLQLRGEKARADAVAEYKAKIAEMLAPEHIDAALAKNEQLKMERSGFGLPADLASRDAHVANLTGAIDDLMEGRPVTMRQPDLMMIPDEAAAKVQADVDATIRAMSSENSASGQKLMPAAEAENGEATTQAADLRADGRLYNTSGLPNKGRDLIHEEAGRLAGMLRSVGLDVEIQYSGSAVGPSAYLSVFDPDTGLAWKEIRVSGHSKGAFNTQFTNNVSGTNAFESLRNAIEIQRIEARLKDGYVSLDARQINQRNGEIELARQRHDRALKASELEIKQNSGEVLSSKEKREVKWLQHEIKQGRNPIEQSAPGKVGAGDTAANDPAPAVKDSLTTDPAPIPLPDSIKPETVIPIDDADATTTVAEAQGIITDLETAAREQETGLRAAVACFLRAA